MSKSIFGRASPRVPHRVPVSFFERLFYVGWTEVEEWQLKAWFGKERLRPNQIDALREEYRQYCDQEESDECDFKIVESQGDKLLFIDSKRFATASPHLARHKTP